MRSKMVRRYWCDHCNKAGLSAGHMTTHEKHCTMNPNRACRVCGLLGGAVAPNPVGLLGLIALLPSEPMPNLCDDQSDYVERVNAAIPKLREASDNCPACILAALRQGKISPGMASESFDFKAEMREIFGSLDEGREPIQGYDY